MYNDLIFEELLVYGKNINYCKKCWVEFTTLSEIEQENLKKILLQTKNIYEISQIECVENGKIFNGINELSKWLNLSTETLISELKLKRKIKGLKFKLLRD